MPTIYTVFIKEDFEVASCDPMGNSIPTAQNASRYAKNLSANPENADGSVTLTTPHGNVNIPAANILGILAQTSND